MSKVYLDLHDAVREKLRNLAEAVDKKEANCCLKLESVLYELKARHVSVDSSIYDSCDDPSSYHTLMDKLLLWNCYDLVRQLLQHGADVNARNAAGQSVLMRLCMRLIEINTHDLGAEEQRAVIDLLSDVLKLNPEITDHDLLVLAMEQGNPCTDRIILVLTNHLAQRRDEQCAKDKM